MEIPSKVLAKRHGAILAGALADMGVTQILTLGKDPNITAAFLAQVDQARPGKYKAFTAHSLQQFQELAIEHKQHLSAVVLGAAQTDEQVASAKTIISQVWQNGTVQTLRVPPSLLTPEGKQGDMMRWFLEHMEGAIEGECGCC